MIRVVVLDFDGVIVESVDIKTEVFRELFREKVEVLDQILAYHLQNNGVSRLVKLRHIYEHFLKLPYNEKIEQEVTERFSALVFERVVRCSYVPGALDFIEQYSRLCPIYLASSTPQKELEQIVAARNISHCFRGVFGAPRPKEAAIEKILSREGILPVEAVFVGDSIEDYRVAEQVSIRFVARRNKESFAGLGVPVFPDMVAVHRFLADGFPEIARWAEMKRGVGS